jgi:carboxymethylenebutenolidase
MADRISITAPDSHSFDAWRANAATPKGGIVLIHAIYGLTPHMADLCDDFAAAGYSAVAPAFFDRVERGLICAYDSEAANAGRAARNAIAEADMLADAKAAADALRDAGCKRVAVLGFCMGGTWTWFNAAAGAFDAAVVYYGSNVWDHRDRTPACPTIMHYGDTDRVQPMEKVEAVRALHPGLEWHIYPGGQHAFYNPEQASYHPEAAPLARTRTLDFLGRTIAAV